MIYNFEITTQENRNFQLNIEIDAEDTFFSLHKKIQEVSHYEDYHLAAFIVVNLCNHKSTEVSQIDLEIKNSTRKVMTKTLLKDLIHVERQRMHYTYDLVNNRSFLIELKNIDMEKNLEVPCVTSSKGNAPQQVQGANKQNSNNTETKSDEIFLDFGIVHDYTELFGGIEES